MTKIVIVDSVKGGCGKTTEALIEAVCNVQNDKMLKVCIVDMDLLGTSMESMIATEGFIKDDKKIAPYIKLRAKNYLNDLPDDLDAIKHCVSTVSMKTDKGEFDLDFVVSSPNGSDRRKFRQEGDSNYTVEITPTHFRGVIKKLVESLIALKYDTIIFDMPPNSDNYTACVFELLLNKRYRDKMENKINSVELKIVSTLDGSHVRANSNWLIRIFENDSEQVIPFDKITFILNNNSIAEDGTDLSVLKSDIKMYILKVLPGGERDKVLFKSRDYSVQLNKHFLFKESNEFNNLTGISGVFHEGIDIP